ncbi:hypothetical protein BDN72DRAFT_885116 [Pluteus cervinus]|uniref:Uncharacterized protein n=1 Tax=Pluteus cervinus TaxID=181527 RepID=A0ACD3BEP6_9AGAR|nr:hypothetical protein BDN72DRAFT_885116 [Pluteus cervinus]
MAIPTLSRRERTQSPPITTTPSQSRYSRVMQNTSPPPSAYSPTVTPNGHSHRLNVVTRVAVEGKARQDRDGVSVKMYLKISLPLDSVTPGSTIPLFSEENVKILSSEVHPLDNNSVPYNFSSAHSPLLHNAARALNLSPRLRETYQSVVDLQGVSTPSSSSPRVNGNGDGPAPVDPIFTGHILVSGYHISYVLPKVFLQPKSNGATNDIDMETTPSRLSSRSRRSSIGERTHVHYMAAIVMWIPYFSRPPRSPYLLSIPTPKCLHNNIKLRIFPPSSTAASFASLSSVEEDGGAWELTSDPHVTRASARISRSSSYTHFADDESSDSSEQADGCLIQGTFPSAERIRIRWAKPVKTVQVHGDSSSGRRRVGVKEVTGEAICRETRREGVAINVDYKGTCRGVWFPGVATLLGMDVGLEAKGCDVAWLDGHPPQWEISGGTGFTGYDTGQSPRQADPDSRASSLDSAPPQFVVSSPNEPRSMLQNGNVGGASLLRAPLPSQHVGDYSFEASAMAASSATASAMAGLSSLSSVPTQSSSRPPGQPITLHINMNELLPPAQNVFTFTICGTVLVMPRSSTSKPNGTIVGETLDGISLPRFTVLAADDEYTTMIVRNELGDEDSTLELLAADDRDGSRCTIIRKGGVAKCPENGAKMTVRNASQHRKSNPSPSRPRTPSKVGSHLPLSLVRPHRSGPLMIPTVLASVTPLDSGPSIFDHAVSLTLDAPSQLESGWIEFGIAGPASKGLVSGEAPTVEIASASVDGVPVEYEVLSPQGKEKSPVFEAMNRREWLSWFRFHVGVAGGRVVVDYVVHNGPGTNSSAKKRDIPLHIFLPTFSMQIGKLEVLINSLNGLEACSLKTNFMHQQITPTNCRVLHLPVKEFFYPEVQVDLKRVRTGSVSLAGLLFNTLLCLAILASFSLSYRLELRVNKLQESLEQYSAVALGIRWNHAPDPLTITTTLYATSWRTNEPSPSNPVLTSLSILTTPAITSQAPTLFSTTPLTSTSLDPIQQSTSQSNSLSLYTTSFLRQLLSSLPPGWIDEPIRTAHSALHEFMRAINRVVNVMSRAYHYPMNPP